MKVGGTGLVVTNTNASGDGSLAQAVLNDNALAQPGTITFANNLSGTITLGAALELSNVSSSSANPEEIDGLGTTTLTIAGNAVMVDPRVAAVITGLTIDSFDNNSSALSVDNCTFEIVPGSFTSVGGTFAGGVVFDIAQGANVTLQAAGTFTSGVTFNLAQSAALILSTGSVSGGTVFNLGPAAQLDLEDGTFVGGISFDFNSTQAGTVDVDDGQVSGTLTGTGLGTVQIDASRLYLGNGGATFNFPGAMLEWTSGVIDAGNGNLTNLGTITLAGSSDKGFYNDGTLDNFGAIVQTGSGNLLLGTDNVFPSLLKIEPGTSYSFENDSGIGQVQDHLGTAAFPTIDNAGTMIKTAGTGISTITIAGTLTNTGTIEADSGTLFLDAANMAQLSGTTLTGGTWNALDGANLEFPTGTAINTNAANISLGGPGATIAAVTGLAANSGSFTLTGGANFSTIGAFANSGQVTVGAGSILTVSSTFIQSSAGALNIQIGGVPGSGQIGDVAVSTTATLAGALNIALVNAFDPAAGQVFQVLTFTSVTGAFTAFGGLNPFFTQQLQPNAQEIVDTSTNAVDLDATSVAAPTAATAGQQITVSWRVTNLSSLAATGSWQDSVYLSTAPTITLTSVLVGTVEQNSGLAASANYTGSLTAAVPALEPGFYYVLVQVDSLYQVPDPNRANNTLAAGTGQLDVSVPALTVGVGFNDSFTAADQDRYYQVTVPAGGTLSVTLQSHANSGATALYVSQGTLPTPFNYQEAAAIPNQANQTVVVPQVQKATTYFILANSVSGNAATATYTLTAAQGSGLTVSAISSYAGGNAGNVTIEIDGTNFSPTPLPVSAGRRYHQRLGH